MHKALIATLLALTLAVASSPHLAASPQDDKKDPGPLPASDTASPPAPTRTLGEALLEAAKKQAESTESVNGFGAGTVSIDTHGVEFGPWIRRFMARVRRNWFIPAATSSKTGHATLTFTVARDGKISNLKIAESSRTPELDRAAFNAVTNANPLEPLPEDYPKEEMAMTTTFYYNEQPPGTPPKGDTPSSSGK